ncbi:MAG: hydantoinase B/oxoprolinase family protein [Rhodopila sp.]
MDAQQVTTADPVVTEIVRGALRSIQLEMEALIERTAMSPFIREKKDFHTALFDRDGRLIAGKSLPIASNIIEPILERYPAATMRPGDIYWYNDCYASQGAVSHTLRSGIRHAGLRGRDPVRLRAFLGTFQ